ncbi:multicopper oxidase domain-containing protein [Salinisphaera sp. SPP-AMP-43]|uniref:multicopper oxidase family protein n=1 Tax=Salinisphaera sp. SPP-AMP-43 TaxID=3121288 RepID=UPI003C6E4EC0
MTTIDRHGRRRVLKGLAAGLAGAALWPAGVRAGRPGWHALGAEVLDAGVFQRPLPIPAQATGELDADGVRHYQLVARPGTSELVAGIQTPTWSYNGAWLGPTLRIPRHQPVALHVHNGLDQPTTLHWHGAQVPGQMDGGPHSVIAPGETWTAAYTLSQPAATLWYHPHPQAYTGPQVYAGLAGMLWVDDDTDRQLGLPRTYGIDDLPVAIQDRRLDAEGRLAYMTAAGDVMGMKGDRFLVNGVEQPYAEVAAGWLRLRVLNASNARNLNLAFADGRRFYVIAGDAGLLAEPTPMDQLLLAPAERVQILVDLRGDYGRRVVLASDSGAVVPDLYRTPMAVDDYDRRGFDLLELRVGPSLALGTGLPEQLVEPPSLEPDGATRRFLMNGMIASGAFMHLQAGHGYAPRAAHGPGGMSAGVGGRDLFAINGEYMDMDKINVHVKLGATEVWQVTNVSLMAHPFHMHGTSFLIRARGGKTPPPQERSWKDVVLVRGGETVELVARFEHPAAAEHAYMYHCHTLEHEDNGMMGQFVVA